MSLSFRSFHTVALIILSTALLAACSSTKTDDQSTLDSGMGGPLTGAQGYDPNAVGAGGVVPGTQQDLAVNVGDRVFFGYDRIDLTPEARQVLELQAQWLNRYPNLSITIEGHADERGTREYNIALGDRRATTVRNYLTSLGVSAARITTISYGKERPAIVGNDETSWAQNRRAVTVVN